MCNNNAPVYPVLPGHVFSTDNSTVFVFKGKTEKLDGWHLLQSAMKEAIQSANQPIYGNGAGGTEHKNSLRVRSTSTMNATCMLATVFIIIIGLTERYFPQIYLSNWCPCSYP